MRYLIKNVDYMGKSVRVGGYKRTLADVIGQLGIEFCVAMKRMFGDLEGVELNDAQVVFVLGLHNQEQGCTTHSNSWSGGYPPVSCVVAPERWWETVKPRLIKMGIVKEVE